MGGARLLIAIIIKVNLSDINGSFNFFYSKYRGNITYQEILYYYDLFLSLFLSWL